MKLLAHSTVVRSPTLGLTAISLGFLMITLDATIVNVALGPIGNDLGGAVSTAQWIINGYTLAFAALLLTAGALADRLGLRTGFLAGLAVFAVGSAACAGATSLAELIVARVVQGAGAAALMPCSLALIAHTFPDLGTAVARSAFGVARRELAWPPDPSSAASSPPPLAGARSSWSMCRSPPWLRNSCAVTLQKRSATVTRLTSPARSSRPLAWRR